MRSTEDAMQVKERKVFLYLRLSVDKEDGKAQSIEAQRHEAQRYAESHNLIIVREFVESGISGRSATRPQFQQMIADATDASHPVDAVLFIGRLGSPETCKYFSMLSAI